MRAYHTFLSECITEKGVDVRTQIPLRDQVRHAHDLGADDDLFGLRLGNAAALHVKEQIVRELPGPWRIEVVKSQKKLRLYRSLGEGKGEELFFAFDIGIGRRNSTPTGDFAIYNHVTHPEWTAPTARRFGS